MNNRNKPMSIHIFDGLLPILLKRTYTNTSNVNNKNTPMSIHIFDA